MFEVRHIGIVTSENKILKMLDFYGAMGFLLFKQDYESGKMMRIYTGLDSNIKTYKMSNGKSIIEFLIFFKDIKVKKEINSKAITHVAFTVDDLNHIKKLIQKYGGIILSKKKYRKDNSSPYVMFCRDPDGNILELVEGNVEN